VKTRRNVLGVYSSVGEKILAHYRVHERIGEGGVALVYKARDTRLGRWVALKVLQPWAMGHVGFRQQLIHEAQAASALNHPNIVTVHEVSTDENGVCFIVMEYVAGQALNAVIPPRGLSVRKALDYALQMMDALRATESAGIVHGDLKPQNIMVTSEGLIKLLDFGLARAGGRPSSQEELLAVRFGTELYMAPERLKGAAVEPNPRSDIFSVGLILRLLFTGRHPFLGTPRHGAARVTRYDTPIALPPKVPASLAGIIRRCLLKNPRQRFRSMRELFDALHQCNSRQPKRALLNNQHDSTTRPKVRISVDLQVRKALHRIGYHNVTASRQALLELRSMLDGKVSKSARQVATTALANLIVKGLDFSREVPMSVREFRTLIFKVLIAATHGRLASWFANGELENLDLYEMDFSGAHLTGVSFRGAFLVGANFAGSDLTHASFAGAWIRNVNFEAANLSVVDFTDADWFNTLGLTEVQIRAAQIHTLPECPENVKSMHRYLDARYGFPFASWPSRQQRELGAAWRQYWRPGGLGGLINSVHAKSG
jgi:serine/threonine protein kinase